MLKFRYENPKSYCQWSNTKMGMMLNSIFICLPHYAGYFPSLTKQLAPILSFRSKCKFLNATILSTLTFSIWCSPKIPELKHLELPVIKMVSLSLAGIVWHRDPNILFSCGKDSMIYQNWFMDAYRPTEHASPVALGFSSTGNITFARSNQLTAAPEPKLKQYVRLYTLYQLNFPGLSQFFICFSDVHYEKIINCIIFRLRCNNVLCNLIPYIWRNSWYCFEITH